MDITPAKRIENRTKEPVKRQNFSFGRGLICKQKQHDLLRLLLKSGAITSEDRQAAISIAGQQNDQESLSILNEE